MVSDLLFFAGVITTMGGLIWWSPPAAVIFLGLSLIVVGVTKHQPRRSGHG